MRTSVSLGDGTGEYRLGSGYLIADGLVLTAAHVLAPPAVAAAISQVSGVEVAQPEGGWELATVAWADVARDVAVLACPAVRAAGRVRWGRLAGPDPLDWGAVGFPAASAAREGERQAEHAFGRTSPISERAAGRLALTIESRDATKGRGSSLWAGLSGAAVFCGDHLTGVITADTGGYERSLTARRADDFCHDPALAEILGGTPVLEDVTGRPREPGLADLRTTLRPRNAAFIGRAADMAFLAAQPGGRMVLTQSLTGLGGVGKSALALEYAHYRYDAGETELAWWFTAEDRPVLLAAMAGLYDRLTGAPGGQDAEAGAIALRNWLEHAPYRWIVVFDNAEPGALDGILPAEGTGQVIITSRVGDWPGTAAHTIGTLPPDEAAALLARIAGLPASQDARDLAAELGGLALAIEQAAAYIRQARGTYADYLQALRTDPRTVYETDRAHSETVTERVWRKSLAHVTAGTPGHPAAAVLGVLSYLAPDDIPRQLLAPDAVKDALVLEDLAPVKVSMALASLADYSLITLDTDAISVHRVIQHLTRLDAETRDMAIPYCSAAISILSMQTSDSPPRIPVARLLPHVLDATAHAQNLHAAPSATAWLLNSGAWDLQDAGQLDTARPLLDRALDIAQENLEPDHPETLTARANLARWLGEAGQPDQAAAQSRDLLADFQRVLGPDHPETFTARANLAYWMGAAGQPAQAAAQYRDLLADELRVLGPDHPETLATFSNLARWLGEAGQPAQAAAQFRDLLADRLRVLGPDHPQTLTARSNLAYWMGEAGQPAQAAAQYRDLLADELRVLGPEHPETLTTRGNLARCLLQAGQPARAAAQYRDLLADRLRVLGPDHPHTLAARANLARCLGEAGQPDQAAAQFRDLLADELRVLGPDHPETLNTRDYLAHWTGEAGQPDQAAAQFRDLLADVLRVLGPDHPYTLTARGNLAYWVGEAGRPDQAAAQYRDLLADVLRVLGPDHPHTLTTRANLDFWLERRP